MPAPPGLSAALAGVDQRLSDLVQLLVAAHLQTAIDATRVTFCDPFGVGGVCAERAADGRDLAQQRLLVGAGLGDDGPETRIVRVAAGDVRRGDAHRFAAEHGDGAGEPGEIQIGGAALAADALQDVAVFVIRPGAFVLDAVQPGQQLAARAARLAGFGGGRAHVRTSVAGVSATSSASSAG
jgi:hypothetical protein